MNKNLPIVAIVGRANVGKSSLFNSLVGRRQAIVSDMAGTTRDRVIEKAMAGDKPYWLVDTAGLKKPQDELEMGIQEQIEQATDSADLIIVVIEADKPITEEDRFIAKKAHRTKKPVILVVNKSDKKGVDQAEYLKLGIKKIIKVSTTQNWGQDDLEKALSASLPKKESTDPTTLTISFVGRPNVGKSLLFNKLLKQNRAVVSDTAGTTRDVNKARIKVSGKEYQIQDTAGVRKNSKNKDIEFYSSLRTLRSIENSDVCVLVIDATEPATKQDQKIAGMIKDAGRGLIIAMNKWDLVEKDETTFDQISPYVMHAFQFVNWAPLVVVSGKSGQNVLKFIDLAEDIVKTRKIEIETSKLNSWLAAVLSHHPPAGLKNRHPKIKYVTQTDSNPPTFTFFGHNLKYLHWSYKRYMERELRQYFEIFGTSIWMKFSTESKKQVK